MELGKKIVKIRKDNDLTQEDFAEKYNVTRQTISSWENSKSYTDINTLVKISDDFSVSLDILLKEDKKVIEDISNSQRDSKKYKKILRKIEITIGAIVISILILFLAYILIYNISKYSIESHFNRVLKENNFYKSNEFTYSLIYADNVTYNVPTEISINKILLKIDSRTLDCTVNLDSENILWIVWADYDYYGAVAYHPNPMKSIFNMDVYDEITDRIQFIEDNIDIEEELLKNIIDKGNDIYKQLYG